MVYHLRGVSQGRLQSDILMMESLMGVFQRASSLVYFHDGVF